MQFNIFVIRDRDFNFQIWVGVIMFPVVTVFMYFKEIEKTLYKILMFQVWSITSKTHLLARASYFSHLCFYQCLQPYVQSRYTSTSEFSATQKDKM